MSDKAPTSTALTKDAKAMIQLAFQDLGGLPRLVEWANNPVNLSQFYTQIWAKIIPKDIKSEVSGSGGGPVKMSISWMSDQNDIEEISFTEAHDVQDSNPI